MQSGWLTQVRCACSGLWDQGKCLTPSCPRRKVGLAVGPFVGVDTLGSQNLITPITRLHGQWEVIKGCFSHGCFYFLGGCAGSLLPHAGFLKLQQAGATLHCGLLIAAASLLQSTGSKHGLRSCTCIQRCSSRALEHRLGSCDTLA